MSPIVAPKWLKPDTVAARLELSRHEVFALIERGALATSLRSRDGKVEVDAASVADFERDHAPELAERARRARIAILNAQIEPLQEWADWMLSRGCGREDISSDCGRLLALLEERNALEREQAAEVVRLLELGVDPPWAEAARARIRQQEQANP